MVAWQDVRRGLAGLFLLVAVAQLALALPGGHERAGDRVQVALPLLGAACAVAGRDFGSYAARFAGLMAVVHGAKNGLGTVPANVRPGGGTRGFPSGHTAAAAFGTSALLRTCMAAVPGAGPVLVLAAGYVAGSRIEAGRHTLVQVVAGAVAGVGFDRGLRGGRARRRLGQLAAAAAQASKLAARRLASAPASRPVVASQSGGAVAIRAGKSIGGFWTSLASGRPARM